MSISRTIINLRTNEERKERWAELVSYDGSSLSVNIHSTVIRSGYYLIDRFYIGQTLGQ